MGDSEEDDFLLEEDAVRPGTAGRPATAGRPGTGSPRPAEAVVSTSETLPVALTRSGSSLPTVGLDEHGEGGVDDAHVELVDTAPLDAVDEHLRAEKPEESHLEVTVTISAASDEAEHARRAKEKRDRELAELQAAGGVAIDHDDVVAVSTAKSTLDLFKELQEREAAEHAARMAEAEAFTAKERETREKMGEAELQAEIERREKQERKRIQRRITLLKQNALKARKRREKAMTYSLLPQRFKDSAVSSMRTKSPGPQYDIKSSIGDAPKFTMYGKLEDQAERKRSPGPAAYVVGGTIGSGPKIALSSRTKLLEEYERSPGPAAYESDKWRKHAPSPSFGLRIHPPSEDDTGPGPAAYKVASGEFMTLPRSPSPHIGQKLVNLWEGKRGESPGPAHYVVRDQGFSPAPSIGLRSVEVPHKVEGESPGPIYLVPTSVGKAPAFAIKSRTPLLEEKERSPGPAAYVRQDGIGTNKKHGFSLSSTNHEPPEPERSPGPGAYAVHSTFGEGGGPRMKETHVERRFYDVPSGPGPGAYNPAASPKKSGGVTLKGRGQPTEDAYRGSSSPGPKYMVPTTFPKKAGKAVTLKGRPGGLPPVITPAPWDYFPSDKQKEGVSMKGERFEKSNRAKSPGPAAYTLPSVVGSGKKASFASPAQAAVAERLFRRRSTARP